MSFRVASPNHRKDGPPEDGAVDRLLRAFYRAEMPAPWPKFEAPAETPAVLPFPTPSARRPFSWRSRLALAASVTLLVTGMGILSGKFSSDEGPRPGFHMSDGTASPVRPGSYGIPKVFINVKPNGDSEFKAIGDFIEEPPLEPGR